VPPAPIRNPNVHISWLPAAPQPEGWTHTGYVVDALRWDTPPGTPVPPPTETTSVQVAPDVVRYTLYGLKDGAYEFRVRVHATHTDGTTTTSSYAPLGTPPPCFTLADTPTPPGALSAHPFDDPTPARGPSPSRGTIPRAKR
jgi:hypothetical protein